MSSDEPASKALFTDFQVRILQRDLTKLTLENIPDPLIQSEKPHFLLWSPTPSTDQPKILKKPFTGNSWQNNLKTFKEVIAQREQYHAKHLENHNTNPDDKNAIAKPPLGIGFAYTDKHPFICVDIDAASDENEELMAELDSYTEWSPSLKGLHTIICLPSVQDKLDLIDTLGSGKRNKKAERDLFISSGYVTLTGQLAEHIPGVVNYNEIRTISLLELQPILEKYFLPNPIVTPINAKKNVEEGKAKLEHLANNKRKEDKKNKPLNPPQVQKLLDYVPVQSLTSTTLQSLNDPNVSSILDPNETEEAREPWLTIGQAIHHNFKGSIEGMFLWTEWSRKGNKFDETALNAAWKSFSSPDNQKNITIATLIKLANAQKPQFPDLNSKGAILGTHGNFKAYMDYTGIKVRTHELTKQIIFSLPNTTKTNWDLDLNPNANAIPTSSVCELMRSDLITLGAAQGSFSTKQIKALLTAMAAKDFYNPIREYFKDLPEWDGHDYISDLLDTVTSQRGTYESPAYRRAYGVFLRKWLIQVVAAACHDKHRPVRLNRVLIFVGPQGIGKTEWVSSLFPEPLRRYCSSDKDIKLGKFKSESTKLAMELSSMLICNVNEIDTIFASESSASEFKRFLDVTHDSIVLPYGDAPVDMTRRTVFIGSANKNHFLKDRTGNRRVEIIHAAHLDHKHGINIDQLWAQVYNAYMAREAWWLSPDNSFDMEAISIRDKINNCAMKLQDERFAELLDETFNIYAPYDKWKKMDFVTIRKLLGAPDLMKVTRSSSIFNSMKATLVTWLKQISPLNVSITQKGKGERARLYYIMPPLMPASGIPSEAFIAKAESEEYSEESTITREDILAQIEQLKSLLDKTDN